MAEQRPAVITTRLQGEDRVRLDIVAVASGRSRCAYVRDAITTQVAEDLAQLTRRAAHPVRPAIQQEGNEP